MHPETGGFLQLWRPVKKHKNHALRTVDSSVVGDMGVFVKELWIGNKLGTRDVHKLSTLSGHAALRSISAAGAAGKQPGNLSRDISRVVEKDSTAPPIYYAEILVCGPNQ